MSSVVISATTAERVGYSDLTAESLFAEADTADTDFVHRCAVELQAHDPELRRIENFRVPVDDARTIRANRYSAPKR